MKAYKIAAISFLIILAISVSGYGCRDGGGQNSVPTATRTSAPVMKPCLPQVPLEGDDNLFRNPGFESKEDPWCVIHPPMFLVTQDQAHSGHWSALLQMREPADATGTKVFYLVQELDVEEFPELVSGYYRVENWAKGTPKQYLQFVVIVFEAANRPWPDINNHQIRYPMAGIDEDPFKIGNAFFVYVGKDQTRTGEWVYFERNIRQDFQEHWGAVPKGFSKIRVLFEVRYDDKESGAPAEADVYYDDLYIGSASKNPNGPL